MKYKARDLNNLNRCTKRRQYETVSTKSITNNVYDKAVLVKTILKEALINKLSYKEIYDKVIKGFKDIDYPSNETRRINAETSFNLITRYLDWEYNNNRTMFFPEDKDLTIFGINVQVSPDVCFIQDNTLEVVKFKTGKPNITQKGRKLDYSVNNNLELYAMLCYAAKLAEQRNIAEYKASFYFLRKDTDSYQRNIFEPTFYIEENGKRDKNIVSLECKDRNTKIGLDAQFEILFKDFIEGQEGCNDCSLCDFYNVCSYKHAPKTLDVEKEKKKATKLSLTASQNEAISIVNGITRINAGAGAGKTLVVALRTAMLMLKGAKPEDICLLTFTNAGAKEMKERIEMYTKDFGLNIDIDKMTSTTFNSFGYDIIKENHKVLNYPEIPTLVDDVKKVKIITELLNKYPTMNKFDYFNFDLSTPHCKGVLPVIMRAFDVMKVYQIRNNPDGLKKFERKMSESRLIFNYKDVFSQIHDMYMEYNRIITKENMIEYADQELLLLDLIEYDMDLVENLDYKHIIVDEFQDSSDIQIEIIKHLCNTSHFESLMVVGDDSQSIYGFRDTSPDNLINFFEKIGKRGKDIYLVDNYRSTPEIIDLANKVNDLNIYKINKDLKATKPNGKPVVVKGFENSKIEYTYIVEQIQEKIANGVKPEEIAFIARTRNELLEFGSILTQKDIPWILLNPEPMLENSKIIAAIELCKVFVQNDASKSTLIYLNALLGNKLLERTEIEINELISNLQELIEEHQNDREYFNNMLERINDDDEIYESFINTLQEKETLEEAIRYALDFEKYGKNMTCKREKNYPGVVLTTAHSSKGLEFNIVFNSISKYDEKELCLSRNIEETRRLLFVSITRAKEELYITSKWYIGGDMKSRIWNRYMKEICHITNVHFPTEKELNEQKKNKSSN